MHVGWQDCWLPLWSWYDTQQRGPPQAPILLVKPHRLTRLSQCDSPEMREQKCSVRRKRQISFYHRTTPKNFKKKLGREKARYERSILFTKIWLTIAFNKLKTLTIHASQSLLVYFIFIFLLFNCLPSILSLILHILPLVSTELFFIAASLHLSTFVDSNWTRSARFASYVCILVCFKRQLAC